MKKSSYAKAGVDITLGNQVKARLPRMLNSTRRPGVLGKVGGFGGLFQLNTRQYKQPVLVSSVDGVGTKLKVAFAMNRHDTIGEDLVNHCVNDIIVLGAEPLFFLDYLGTGKLDPRVFTEIVGGFARGCARNHCALIGGETAQMPGFYQPGEYDVSGTIVGAVEKKRLLTGQTIRPGDAVIGLASSGLHTNGYSLARHVFFQQMKLKPTSYLAELGCTVGEELLKVHRSYGPLVASLLKRFNTPNHPLILKGLAHITGGGFVDNIPRILPAGCDVHIQKQSWTPQPVFQILRQHSRTNEAELYQVFNMGIGMVLIVPPNHANALLKFIRGRRQKAWLIGEVTKGNRQVSVE